MKEFYREIEVKMKHAVDHFREELKTLRAGRASLAILDSVRVDYFGTPTPLSQVANLSVAEATLIVVQPWDPSLIGDIERAVHSSGIGLNPANDGKVIRLPIPPLTEERRKELVKRAHDMAEATRNGIRQARREGNDGLKHKEKDKEISQDEEHRGYDETQKLHDHYIGLTGSILEVKEKDILAV